MPRVRISIPTQRIILGDCLDVFANERNVPAFVSDPPANIAFMGRSWDRANPALDYVPLIPARDKAHLRELQSEFAFSRYWATRYAMAYDIADQHATMILWTLPRTSHQTANALRAAGWTIKDNLVHLFGTGWAKTGNALAPGQEGWLLATKGKPDLDIDACRVPRGMEGDSATNPLVRAARGCKPAKQTASEFFGRDDKGTEYTPNTNGSLPKNALLSHCEECVRVGVREVSTGKFTDNSKRTRFGNNGPVIPNKITGEHPGYSGKTESVPAWHCLAGCVCGARSKWDPEKPLPRCPCGEVWRWWCAVAEVNGQSGHLETSGTAKLGKLHHHRPTGNESTYGKRTEAFTPGYPESGGASRFFNTFSYLAKCSSSERHAGCENLYWRANKKNPFGFDQVTREEWEGLEAKKAESFQAGPGTALGTPPNDTRAQGNVHPTVKSYRLMHWLHSLTGAKRILDLTAGSGTGMYTAVLDGIEWLGAEICPDAVTIANARHAFWTSLHPDAIASFRNGKSIARKPKVAIS